MHHFIVWNYMNIICNIAPSNNNNTNKKTHKMKSTTQTSLTLSALGLLLSIVLIIIGFSAFGVLFIGIFLTTLIVSGVCAIAEEREVQKQTNR